jgi:hypothetical protein
MKVQLSGKEYKSNLEGFGFEPMLDTFFSQLSAPDGVVGPHGTQWGWSGPRAKCEFKLKYSFEFG